MPHKIKLKLIIIIANTLLMFGIKSDYVARGIIGIINKENERNAKIKEAFKNAGITGNVHKTITIKTDGLLSIQFKMECENAIWFDGLILFPLMKLILMKWLKWGIKGGHIIFTYKETL